MMIPVCPYCGNEHYIDDSAIRERTKIRKELDIPPDHPYTMFTFCDKCGEDIEVTMIVKKVNLNYVKVKT